MATDFSFTTIFAYNGTSYGNNLALEAQSPAGTSFSVLGDTDHFLYLGHESKFDMALFDLDTVGTIGTPKWEYSNGSNWTEFIPGSGRHQLDPDDTAGAQWAFDKDGAEQFPINVMDSWATLTVNSVNIYWVRASTASYYSTHN